MNHPVTEDKSKLINNVDEPSSSGSSVEASNNKNSFQQNKQQKRAITEQPTSNSLLSTSLGEPSIDVTPKTRLGHSCNNCKCCIINWNTERQQEEGQSAS